MGADAAASAPLARTVIGTVADRMPGYARRIDDGEYPALDSAIDTHPATMRHIIDEGAALGVSTELPESGKPSPTGRGRRARRRRLRRVYRTVLHAFEEVTTMTAEEFDPRALLAESRLGVLATIKSDGRPQLSPVTPYYDRDAGVLYVSMTEGRAKTANLRRDPRAALEVTRPDGRAWATAEGPVTLTGPGTDPHGPEVEALVEYYRRAAGEHPDWEEYRSVMVADRRVLMAMTVGHVYGDRLG